MLAGAALLEDSVLDDGCAALVGAADDERTALEEVPEGPDEVGAGPDVEDEEEGGPEVEEQGVVLDAEVDDDGEGQPWHAPNADPSSRHTWLPCPPWGQVQAACSPGAHVDASRPPAVGTHPHEHNPTSAHARAPRVVVPLPRRKPMRAATRPASFMRASCPSRPPHTRLRRPSRPRRRDPALPSSAGDLVRVRTATCRAPRTRPGRGRRRTRGAHTFPRPRHTRRDPCMSRPCGLDTRRACPGSP